ncbi:DgyrCDS9916 [Dimorphilus gyrociliatus]|uniref:DgyrCDS9916 n=1 Tax=Dimorphilus gyrociliatus TaxID=2664684 RepID=A0A7I8VZU9_9ANNE|nr:DgyrCDS9916 [Dimorphilus gyrociliatus]
MSKVLYHDSLPKSELPEPKSGKWEWREDTNTLEFTNFQTKKDAKRKAAADKHKSVDRGATPSRANKKSIPTWIPKKKDKDEGPSHINLVHIKESALSYLTEHYEEKDDTEDMDKFKAFEAGVYHTKQLDEFLMFLLKYFELFFEKFNLDNKPNPMNIEPSQAEVAYYHKVCDKLLAAQKLVGYAYGILILGDGMSTHHHMSCGVSRVSNTYKDRNMFECLYKFCSVVVEKTFVKRNDEAVRTEVNRMMRSHTFNPALRIKLAPDAEKNTDEVKLTPAEYRRQHGNRPAIKSIITQKSPALISILPSSKEGATYLFQRKQALSAAGISDNKSADEIISDDSIESVTETLSLETLKVGIIGESSKDYDLKTLIPHRGGEGDDPSRDEKERLSSRRASLQTSDEQAASKNRDESPTLSRRETTATSVVTQNEQ